MVWPSRRLARSIVLVIIAFSVLSLLLYTRDSAFEWGQAPASPDVASPDVASPDVASPDLESPYLASPSLDTQPPILDTQPPVLATQPPLSPPRDYLLTHGPLNQYCASRFSVAYLEEIRDHAASYCEPSASSRLTCFHSHSRGGVEYVDSMCVGQGVAFDRAYGRFTMDCPLRELRQDELEAGIVPFDEFKDYWYETGPHEVFNRALVFRGAQAKRDEPEQPGAISDEKPEATHEAALESVAEVGSAAPSTFILLKREGEGNLWHCMMEIFSLYMTLDILSMSTDLHQKDSPLPYFNLTRDPVDAQIVILDDRVDGPYFDLWTLFATRKPIRLKELAADVAITSTIQEAKVIIPLTGSSNPLWQDDKKVRKCTDAPTLSVFADRVIGFYGIPDPVPRTRDDPIRITFIDRQGRKLRGQQELFDELGKRYQHISIRLVDFATVSFVEQITIARETEILVGVHGAGLTHTLFMRQGIGAMVEIQPATLKQWNYRNIAYMRDLHYFRIHALEEGQEVLSPESPERPDWHFEDIEVEPERFFGVMDAAIKSLYTAYPWDFDTS